MSLAERKQENPKIKVAKNHNTGNDENREDMWSSEVCQGITEVNNQLSFFCCQ